MGVTGRGGFALCAVFVLSVLIGWSEAKCDHGGNKCDLELKDMTLTTPTMMTQAGTPDVAFSVDLKNNDNNEDIEPVTSMADFNLDCIMRYAETDIGKGAGAGTDPFLPPKGIEKKFSTDCIPTENALKSGLNSGETRTLTGQCTLGPLGTLCPKAKYLCLDCEVPTGATFTDKKFTNNIECDRIDSKLQCDIDLELDNTDINNLCPATITSGVSYVQTIPNLTIKNKNPKIAGSKVNDIKANAGNFKFEYLFSSKDVPVNLVGTSKLVTAPADEWDDELKATKDIAKLQKVTIKLEPADCTASTHICLRVTKGATTTYNELTGTPALDDNNYKCCAIATKKCAPDPITKSFTFNGGAVTFKKDVATTVTLDVVLENMGPGDIAAGATTAVENFKFKQFFAAGDYCADNTLDTTPAAPARCASTVDTASTNPKESGLTVGPANTKTFMIKCDMTLPAAKCAAMKRLCVDFEPGTGATYADSDPSNNCKCTTTDIKKFCTPDVKAVALRDVSATLVTLIDYDPSGTPPPQATLTFELDIINIGTTPEDDIPAATAAPANFDAKCSMQTALKVKVGSEEPATITINQNAALDGGPAGGSGGFSDTLTGTVGLPALQPTNCASVTQVCCTVFAPGTPPNYVETNLVNNEVCSTAVKKNCKPVFQAGSGMETAPGKTIFVARNKAVNDVVYTLPGIDPTDNPTPPAETLTYEELAGGDPGGSFSLDIGTGAVKVAKALTPEVLTIVYKVKDQDSANGASSTGTLTISIVDTPPKWTPPTATVPIKEDVTAANPNVITMTATDADTDDLSFRCQCNPVTSIFKCKPVTPPASGKELTISHDANPGFDYETTKEYTCYIFAMDGYNVAAMGTVTIKIEDVNEPPTMNFPVVPPGVYPVIKVPELHCYGCHLFDYKCTDQDAGQTTTSTFKVYDTPFDRQAKSKFQVDSLDRLLLNFDNNIIYRNLNKYLTLFTCCDNGTPKKCIFQNVTLEVEPFNRAPTFRPNTTGITIYEGTGTANIILNYLAKFEDPDGNGVSGCGILASRYSGFFDISGSSLQRKGTIDYDTYSPPHHFYITIRCSDDGGDGRADAPDVPSLTTEMLVEVNVLGLDDHDPKFAPTSYTATLFEDAFSTQSVVTVTATDADLGEHGQLVYQLDPSDPNKVLANELFSIVKLENNKAEIRCRGGLDVEKYSSVIFEVNAVSPGPISSTSAAKRTGTATVTVYIRNVNDLRPQWVTPDYINLEISTTAKVDKLMTTVSCTDADILYNNVNYDQISVTFGGTDYFKTDVYTGEVRSNYTPYEEDERYFVRVVCKDTDPKEDFSGIAIVRIDTYVNWKHVSNWTLCKPMADYKASDQEAFLSSVATLCPPCIPKIHDISEKDGKAVFHLYFIKDNTTYAKNAREYDKVFLETDDILERYYNETLNGPKKSVKDDPVFGGCLVNITRFADEPKDNWFLDTIEGNMMLGFLMSLGFALLVTAVICCARKAAPGRVRIPVTPKGSRPVAPKKVQPVQQKPTTPAPKKQKRPPTPESESDDNLRGAAVLVPPVAPSDQAKIQEAREALVSSINKRDLDDLEKSIDSVHNKGFAHHLAPELTEAEKVVIQLKRLRQIRGRILDLKQSTVAEIRSYQKPPLPVHTVMTATFLLLGHKEAQTKDWKTVQALVGKTGKESLKRRCIELDASKMDPNAAKRARSLYGQFDLEEVKLISAGAATFHLWGETMIEEHEAIAKSRK